MLLICGSRDDRFVSEFLRLSLDAELKTELIEEAELFGSCPFAFERQGSTTKGFLNLHQQVVSLNELQGVILRLPRLWWPSHEFDLQDQMFVYHEVTASWFALIDCLTCPVVNRFGLGWWLQDLSYSLELRDALALAIGAETIELEGASLESIRQWPAQPGDDRETKKVIGVYRSAGVTIPNQECPADLLAHLKAWDMDLSQWESESGITLYRMDFEKSDGLRLKWIDVQPSFADESKELLEESAVAALRGITMNSKVTV